jgi:hypothetical protein
MTDAPEAPPVPLPAARIGLWQAAATAVLVLAVILTGRGSVAGVVGGAVLMYASLLLQHLAFGMAVRGGARSGIAVGLFVLKLGVLLTVAAIGLRATWLAPMSFAAGASTLLLAIVLETCYPRRSASRPR